MTEPTDAEIIALADETRTAEGGANGYILPISFARAVLAKWGTPPAVESEPVAWYEYARKKPSLRRLVFERTSRKDLRTAGWVAEPLYTTPQPTQADSQPVPVVDRCTKQQMTTEVLRRMQQQEDGHNKNPFRSLLDRLMRNEGGYSTIEIGQLKYALDGFYGAARAPADNVLEDAARYRWLVDYLIDDRHYLDDAIIACDSKQELDDVIDAARKQGGKA